MKEDLISYCHEVNGVEIEVYPCSGCREGYPKPSRFGGYVLLACKCGKHVLSPMLLSSHQSPIESKSYEKAVLAWNRVNDE